MAFEYLDLENKLYIPTQELMIKFQTEFMTLYSYISQYLIDTHSTIASLSLEWYADPINITTRWYDSSVIYSHELYTRVIEGIIPGLETKYEEILVVSNEFGTTTLDNINYIIDNPDKITAESIESMTVTLTEVGNISAELATELQNKTSEITSLLLDQPMQTLESAYVDLLTALLKCYFELVSHILVNI